MTYQYLPSLVFELGGISARAFSYHSRS
jgi:hypothetical protein